MLWAASRRKTGFRPPRATRCRIDTRRNLPHQEPFRGPPSASQDPAPATEPPAQKQPLRSIDINGTVVPLQQIRSAVVLSEPLYPHIFSWWLLTSVAGLMLLPAVAASFWAREVWSMTLIAAPMAFLSGAIGLLVSFHAGLPSGPLIVLIASLFFLGSLLLGSRASVRARLSHPVHLRG